MHIVSEIMTIRILLLIFAFALVTTTSEAQDYRPKKKDLVWGDNAQGLRMAVWTNAETSQVFAVIRNFSAKKICYCDYVLGNFTRLYARKTASSEWQEIKLKPPTQEESENMIHIGSLPCSKKKIVKPNKEMPPYAWWTQGNIKPSKSERSKKYSFVINLNEYFFPSPLSGAVEVKIVQSVFNGRCDEAYLGEVESPKFEISLPFAKTKV